MPEKGVKTPMFLLEIVMNVLSAPAALSLFIVAGNYFGSLDDRAKPTVSR